MIVVSERQQLRHLVDADTLEKVENARDYVIRTGQGDILMSFRWLDHSLVVLHMTPQKTTLWTESAQVQAFANGIEGTGKEELFEFLTALSADDVSHLDELEDRIGNFEGELFEENGPMKENFRKIHRFRKEVWGCKRYFEKMELLTDELMAADEYFLFIDKKYDKLLNQILRTQEYLDQIRQSYEAQVDIEQNSLMRFFTVVTSIFLPLTLIAGWYGMNLMMPEFKWPFGYPLVIILSVAIVVFMIWLFRRKKWL